MSGIYCILNIINGKFYIGSAKIIKQRYAEHFLHLRKNIHINRYLQHAYNKYGKNNFLFVVVELVDHPSILISREQYYIDQFQPAYNICRYAGSCLGRKHTPETIEKIRQANIGKRHNDKTLKKMSKIQKRIAKERVANGFYKKISDLGSRKGTPLSEEHKSKISQSHIGKTISESSKEKMRLSKLGKLLSKIHKLNIGLGNKGKTVSKEVRERISKHQPARKRIARYDLKGNFLQEYDSVTEAANTLKIDRTYLIDNLKGRVSHCKQWIFIYVK